MHVHRTRLHVHRTGCIYAIGMRQVMQPCAAVCYQRAFYVQPYAFYVQACAPGHAMNVPLHKLHAPLHMIAHEMHRIAFKMLVQPCALDHAGDVHLYAVAVANCANMKIVQRSAPGHATGCAFHMQRCAFHLQGSAPGHAMHVPVHKLHAPLHMLAHEMHTVAYKMHVPAHVPMHSVALRCKIARFAQVASATAYKCIPTAWPSAHGCIVEIVCDGVHFMCNLLQPGVHFVQYMCNGCARVCTGTFRCTQLHNHRTLIAQHCTALHMRRVCDGVQPQCNRNATLCN